MNSAWRFDMRDAVGYVSDGMWMFPAIQSTAGRLWQIGVGLMRDGVSVPLANLTDPIAPNVSAYHQVWYGMHTRLTSVPFVHAAKNIGRANYSSPLVVAMTRAASLYKKQCAKGYSADGSTGGLLLPMKLQRYDKYAKHILYPAEVSAKCDGLDVMVTRTDHVITAVGFAGNETCTYAVGDICVYSPTKKFYTGPRIQVLCQALQAFFKTWPRATLNGELYCHGRSLEELNSDVRDTTRQQFFQLFVFDCVFADVPDMPYSARMAILQKHLPASSVVCMVPRQAVGTAKETEAATARFVADGFEGGVIANLQAPYVAYPDRVVRSMSKQKIVSFESGEFRIVGFEAGRGRHAGVIKWVVELPSGETFRVNYADCPESFQRQMFARVAAAPEQYMHKLLTVRYRGRTAGGIPKFAKAIAVRVE